MSSPIRVLFLDHTAKQGGAEITLVRILKPIDHEKVTPLALLAEDGPLINLLEDAKVQVRVLPLADDVREVRKDSLGVKALLNPKQLRQMISCAVKVARFARRNRIDIIHTNSLKAHIYGGRKDCAHSGYMAHPLRAHANYGRTLCRDVRQLIHRPTLL